MKALFFIFISSFCFWEFSHAEIETRVVLDSDVQVNGKTYHEGALTLDQAIDLAFDEPTDKPCFQSVPSLLGDFTKGLKIKDKDNSDKILMSIAGWQNVMSSKSKSVMTDKKMIYEAHFKQKDAEITVDPIYLVIYANNTENASIIKRIQLDQIIKVCPMESAVTKPYTPLVDEKSSYPKIDEGLSSLAGPECGTNAGEPVPAQARNPLKSISDEVNKLNKP